MKKLILALVAAMSLNFSVAQDMVEMMKQYERLQIYVTMPLDVESELRKNSKYWLLESYVPGSFNWTEWRMGTVVEHEKSILADLGLKEGEKTKRESAWMRGTIKVKGPFGTRDVKLLVYAYYDNGRKVFQWRCNNSSGCSF